MPYLNEFQRIVRYFQPLTQGFPGALELRDDAALLQPPPDADLVVTSDAMSEGTHFQKSDSPASIAQRLLRSNLSDLAAKGAQPLAYTLVTAFTGETSDEWIAAFADGLRKDQAQFGIKLVGGDTVRAPAHQHFSVTAFGLVPKGQFVARKMRRAIAANEKYGLYVSGTIGDSHLGLQLLLGKSLPDLTAEDVHYLTERHYRPEPRLELGRAMRSFAAAAVDISDGLVADVGHIASLSKIDITLNQDAVPLSPPVQKLVRQNPALLQSLITGGEDYEIAFIVNQAEESLLTLLSAKINLRLTRIGSVEAGTGQVHVVDRENRIVPLAAQGWMHF